VSLVQVSGSTYTVGVTTTLSDGTVCSTNPDGSDNFIFVNESGTWKLAGNGYLSSLTRNPFRAVSYSVTLPGGSASTVTGLALNVGDDWNQGLQSAVITGPGLPTNGVVISKTAGDTIDLVPVATTTPAYTPYVLPLPASYAFIPNTDVYPLTDASINQIPLNAVYTFTIYNVSGTLVETRTKTLPMRPLLSTELAALVTAWPTPLPNVTSHTLASSQVNGTLGFTYTPPPASTFPAVELKGSLQFWDNNGDTAGFPFWNNGSTNVPIPQILPMNVTSAGITSAVSSFTPLAARLDFSAADVFRREVHVQWIFGP
jgi:hypothetical protein